MKKIVFLFVSLLTVAASWADVVIEASVFPDENFRNWLFEQDYGNDGIITDVEFEKVKKINVSGIGVADLTGIELFSKLTDLRCTYNNLTSLDLSNTLELQSLSCSNNQLTSLIVGTKNNLRSIECQNNKITSLDVHNVPLLEVFDCHNNLLAELDVSANSSLVDLNCQSNQLTHLLIPKNDVNLFCLNVADNKLGYEEMDVLVERLVNINEGYVIAKQFGASTEDTNIFTDKCVAAAKAKGWTVFAKKNYNLLVDSDSYIPEEEYPYFVNNPLPVWKSTLKVLAIGNSFVGDAMGYIQKMVSAAGISSQSICVYQVVKGGSSLNEIVKVYNDNLPLSNSSIICNRRVGSIEMDISDNNTLAEVLAKDWDVISLNQYHRHGSYNQINPALTEMISHCREKCTNQDVALAWHEGWSCQGEKGGYDGGSEGWWAMLQKVTETQMRNDGIDIVIPSGTAMQNARNTSLSGEGEMTRDGVHASFGAGRYIVGATWFQTLIAPVFGVSILGNSAVHDQLFDTEISQDASLLAAHEENPDKNMYFPPILVTDSNKDLCQHCAMWAADDFKSVIVEFEGDASVGLVENDAAIFSGIRHNVLGQRVGKDYKGVVIEDGKKILVQ